VGTTLGKRLRERGWRVGAVVTRSPNTARAAARAIGGGNPSSRLTPDVFAADLILFGTPDDALPGIVRELARPLLTVGCWLRSRVVALRRVRFTQCRRSAAELFRN
jgi:prephenate dehydrogenase